MTKTEIASLPKDRATSSSTAGFCVIDKHGDDHNFRGPQWSYTVVAQADSQRLVVYQGDKAFTSWPIDDVRSARPL
jgi:hypothetical protein